MSLQQNDPPKSNIMRSFKKTFFLYKTNKKIQSNISSGKPVERSSICLYTPFRGINSLNTP